MDILFRDRNTKARFSYFITVLVFYWIKLTVTAINAFRYVTQNFLSFVALLVQPLNLHKSAKTAQADADNDVLLDKLKKPCAGNRRKLNSYWGWFNDIIYCKLQLIHCWESESFCSLLRSYLSLWNRRQIYLCIKIRVISKFILTEL